jgi:hypothetical protein
MERKLTAMPRPRPSKAGLYRLKHGNSNEKVKISGLGQICSDDGVLMRNNYDLVTLKRFMPDPSKA